MDINNLKLLLANNPCTIVEILGLFEAHSVNIVNGKRIQFGLSNNRSGRAHCIFLDSKLLHKDYPNGITEDFISMVGRLKQLSYSEAINLITLFLNGGMKSFTADNSSCPYQCQDIPLIEYNIDILNAYPKIVSELFLKDGITASTQQKFGIRFSLEHNRVLIPIFQDNKLVGIFGRWNEKYFDEEFIAKYYPILPYQKGKVLFPWDLNKDSIKKSKFVYLVESEKTPMLVDKWGFKNILALGGNTVKEKQIEMLKELGVKKIILALDKGLGEGFIEFASQRLKEYGFDVYYIDVDSIDYLPNKECVFDLNDKDLVLNTVKKYIRRV